MQNRPLQHIVSPYINDDYIIPKTEYCQDINSNGFTPLRGVSSKASSTPPRRYKCSLCIKRFTRPSSLATHMHSHTGEKPYKCSVDGCGRRFSVVSNLRRHAKIHFGNVQ
ncbi:C2H2-type zinc finger transcription factor [Phycomyces blakesleeanus NRRL 1555(-)]|uniref:C2H2-type zinc finger transcription factor n=1 Tax=Phycomyces blakesleeanus (strain ATCC 8743b / DSM 1359 / FGSC 10004 / NBRC 33097 / NRRL 1555) TaxID=763407 RepID=A0A167QJ59_PHYB8|nr:C2H2-type zinc finger transcription factor [Phycomyces blakesleeanus NRRL 1555(-)]OAD79778.1 C2H2-type zinc finger transcription factor [Phycomyces blakesleeanus NRRL 1555(-)]|eukprot:XP_018297818.1 C2H2-type zinc finger transcription factor [Phycomyces blakesleeanus NRRL 1555(-)]